jgi:hypothetical protein
MFVSILKSRVAVYHFAAAIWFAECILQCGIVAVIRSPPDQYSVDHFIVDPVAQHLKSVLKVEWHRAQVMLPIAFKIVVMVNYPAVKAAVFCF